MSKPEIVASEDQMQLKINDVEYKFVPVQEGNFCYGCDLFEKWVIRELDCGVHEQIQCTGSGRKDKQIGIFVKVIE